MITKHTKRDNQIRRKFQRLKVRLEKYPHQITKEERNFLAKAIAIKEYVESKQGDK